MVEEKHAIVATNDWRVKGKEQLEMESVQTARQKP
jgi:hypothetical protein